MSKLKISANAGINRRFPEHKIVGEKKQYVQQLLNLLNLDLKTYLVGGGSRYNTNAISGDIKWSKKIYYSIGGDDLKEQFVVSAGKIWKGNEQDKTFNQVLINNSLDPSLDQTFYPIDAVIKVAEQVTTFLVDGTFFYKFNGNGAGEWEQLTAKTDVDGNTIQPIYIAEYLDRLWVIVKHKNILIFSKNLNPENFNDSTDAGIVDLSPGKGGFPQALIIHNGFLNVVHEDYIVPITGSSVSSFGVKPGDYIYGRGTRAPRSVVGVSEDFGFLNSNDNEFYMFSDLETPLSYDIKLSELINPVKANFTVAHFDTQLNAIRFSYVLTGEVQLNAEEIYSRIEQKWCGQTRGRNISTYSQWNGRGDDGKLCTGRSDSGILMVNDASLNFDGNAIHYKWVSASYIAAEDEVCNFEIFELDMKSQENIGLPLQYFLDTRLTTSGLESVNGEGEVYNLGFVNFSEQKTFLNRCNPFIDRRKGRMIRFQIEETAPNRVFEFYGINVIYNKDQRIFSKVLLGS